MQRIGVWLLAVWLILSGLLPLLNVNLPQSGLLLAILAVAAGVFLLLEGRTGGRGRYNVRLGILLLAVYLILVGLVPFLKVTLPGINLILAVLAIAAGVLLLVQRDRL